MTSKVRSVRNGRAACTESPLGLSQPGLSKKVILPLQHRREPRRLPDRPAQLSPRHPTVMANLAYTSASSSASVRSISVVSPTMARQLGPG